MISPVKIWREQKKIASEAGKKGKIISWTMLRVPPAGFEYQAPYPVALIKLENGETIVSQLVDYAQKNLRTGQKVITLIRRAGQPADDEVISYAIKAKPI